MTIRRATQAETNYILQLSGKVLNESSVGYAKNNIQNAFNLFIPIIQNGGYYLIDEEDRKLKGWILLGTNWNFLTNQAIGSLLSIYVFPKYRKTGVGKKLTVAAIKELKARGIRTIQVNVFEGNPSRDMSEKLGFKRISTVLELKINNNDNWLG